MTNLACPSVGADMNFDLTYSSYCTGISAFFTNTSLVDIFVTSFLTVSFPYTVKDGEITPLGTQLLMDCNGVFGSLNTFEVESSEYDDMITVQYSLNPLIDSLNLDTFCELTCGSLQQVSPDSCVIHQDLSTVSYFVPEPFGPSGLCTNFTVDIGYRYSSLGSEINN